MPAGRGEEGCRDKGRRWRLVGGLVLVLVPVEWKGVGTRGRGVEDAGAWCLSSSCGTSRDPDQDEDRHQAQSILRKPHPRPRMPLAGILVGTRAAISPLM